MNVEASTVSVKGTKVALQVLLAAVLALSFFMSMAATADAQVCGVNRTYTLFTDSIMSNNNWEVYTGSGQTGHSLTVQGYQADGNWYKITTHRNPSYPACASDHTAWVAAHITYLPVSFNPAIESLNNATITFDAYHSSEGWKSIGFSAVQNNVRYGKGVGQTGGPGTFNGFTGGPSWRTKSVSWSAQELQTWGLDLSPTGAPIYFGFFHYSWCDSHEYFSGIDNVRVDISSAPRCPATIACNTNSDCGANSYTGGPFCQGNSVYRNFTTYTCNNPGTANSTCSNSTTAQLQQTCSNNQTCSGGSCSNLNITCNTNSDCGANSYTGGPFCQGNSVYRNFTTYTCNNPGTANSTCSNSTTAQLQQTCTGNQTCSSGTCSNVNITCSANNDCGTSGFTGGLFCQGNNVYQNYTTYTCNNPGTANSTCSSSTAAQLKTTCAGNQTCSNGSCSAVVCSSNTDCGTSGYTGGNFCQGNSVYRNFTTYTCNNPGTTNATCSSSTTAQLQQTCTGSQTCSGGSCSTVNVACSTNADCGTNSYTGGNFCQSNNVYRNFTTYTCNNPGTSNAYCSNSTSAQLQQTCTGSQTCSSGTCTTTTTCTPHASQRCVGNALYWYDSCGNQQELYQVCAAGQTCSNNACVSTGTSNIVVTTLGRNLSSGNLTWSNSVSASPFDILQIQVTIQNTGTQSANNVVVKDVLPSNLLYKGSLAVDNIANAGDITAGVNIGSIAGGTSKVVTYQIQVASSQYFAFGNTTLANAVRVTADGYATPITSSLSVVVTKAATTPTDVPTGLTNNFLVDSFFLPLMLALAGLWLFKSNILGVPAWIGARKAKSVEFTARHELEKRIAKIKEEEGLA